ncbi:MAG: hypothetical protein WDN03_19530 [Rhizomicrobium sp.]
MKAIYVALLGALLLLAGCSTILADQIIKDAQKKCAADGKQFVQDKVEKGEYVVVSTASVTGHCVGPGDPAYVAPH